MIRGSKKTRRYGTAMLFSIAVIVISVGMLNNYVINSSSEQSPTSILQQNPRRNLADETEFDPITLLSVVYDDTSCPSGTETLSRVEVDGDTNGNQGLPAVNFNAGTNGKVVKLCYGRGHIVAESPIGEIDFVTDGFFGTMPMPQCPSGWQVVLESGTSIPADFNKGASLTWFFFFQLRRQVVMCYRRAGDPLYFLRLLESKTSVPRDFSVHSQDLNQDVGGKRLFLATSQSPSMFAAAVSLAGMGNEPWGTLSWTTAVEDSKTGDITVTARIHCQKDGGPDAIGCIFGSLLKEGVDWTELDSIQFDDLCTLAIEGMEQYWSGNITLHGNTRNFYLNVEETEVEPNKDVDICLNTGEVYARSFNSNLDIVDLTIWYNAKFELDDAHFKSVAAHELGHSPLFEYGGLVHSWGHKGTSTPSGDHTNDTPFCPDQGQDIDLMKYYQDDCGGYDSVKSTNWDKAKLLMTVETYEVE